MSQTLTDQNFRQDYERFVCPSCESQIPREHVVSNIDSITGVRAVKAYCEHCEKLYEAAYRLRGGIWQVHEAVRLITDGRRIAGFRARIDHLSGKMRIHDAA